MEARLKSVLIGTAMATTALVIYVAASQISSPQLPVFANPANEAGKRADITGESGTASRHVINGDAIDRMAIKQLGPLPAPMSSKQLAEIQKTERALASLRGEVMQQQEARLKQLGASSKKSQIDRSAAGKEGGA